MKNQNQNSSNKRYKLYLNVSGWRLGVIYDSSTNECCGIDYDLSVGIKQFCEGYHRYGWHKTSKNFHNYKYIEFDSYKDFKQSYPELLI